MVGGFLLAGSRGEEAPPTPRSGPDVVPVGARRGHATGPGGAPRRRLRECVVVGHGVRRNCGAAAGSGCSRGRWACRWRRASRGGAVAAAVVCLASRRLRRAAPARSGRSGWGRSLGADEVRAGFWPTTGALFLVYFGVRAAVGRVGVDGRASAHTGSTGKTFTYANWLYQVGVWCRGRLDRSSADAAVESLVVGGAGPPGRVSLPLRRRCSNKVLVRVVDPRDVRARGLARRLRVYAHGVPALERRPRTGAGDARGRARGRTRGLCSRTSWDYFFRRASTRSKWVVIVFCVAVQQSQAWRLRESRRACQATTMGPARRHLGVLPPRHQRESRVFSSWISSERGRGRFGRRPTPPQEVHT